MLPSCILYVIFKLCFCFSFTIMTMYNYTSNYSVMTYLEYPIILVQVYVMLYYVLKYKCMLDMTIVPLLTATYFASIAGVLLEILPKTVVSYLVVSFMIKSRVTF